MATDGLSRLDWIGGGSLCIINQPINPDILILFATKGEKTRTQLKRELPKYNTWFRALEYCREGRKKLVIVDDRLYVIGGQEGDFMAKPGSPTTTLNPFDHVAAADDIKPSSSIVSAS
ncbi:hypothetical protein ACFE04_010151 [Oxalis oulophora]